MLDNTEGAIKNGQSRETSKIGYTKKRTKSEIKVNSKQKTNNFNQSQYYEMKKRRYLI
jgi:hypothetical protein